MEQQAEKRLLLACGLVLAAWVWVLPAAAGELDAGGDALASLGALSASELEGERAGEATATTTLTQHVHNTLTTTGNVTGGTLDLAGATIDGSMFVNLFNTGNNVVMQAGLTISIDLP